MGFPGSSAGKESTFNVGDLGLILGLGRSPGGGHGNPLQYPCLESPMDRGAWRAAVPGVAESWTWLSDSAQHYLLISVVAAFLFYSIYACLLSHSRSHLFYLGQSCKRFLYLVAAAAKSLQSCPTLSDPMDCSPPGSPIQARILEWGAIAFSVLYLTH